MVRAETHAGPGWVCPFCPLACEHLLAARASDGLLALQGGDCPRATAALAAHGPVSAAPCEIDGRPCGLDHAIAAAARVLAAAKQPLFAGLGCDVAGARALYPLACACGAISDAAGGDALMQGLRALQDRGQITATIAEVRTRADVLVFIGDAPFAQAPLLADRLGLGDTTLVAARHAVLIGGDKTALAGRAALTVEALPLAGDLADTLALLAAAVAGRSVPAMPPALAALAERLRSASYAVIVGAPSALPAQGALLIETVHRMLAELNQTARAGALWIGGGNGAATANQVQLWLSGLPLRSRAGALGIEHEPLLWGATRLLDDAAIDALLWVSAFDAAATPPATSMPMVALAPPALAAASRREGSVFIPVATPGLQHGGHVFRTDGTVLMPLYAAESSALPSVAEVARRITAALTPSPCGGGLGWGPAARAVGPHPNLPPAGEGVNHAGAEFS